MGLLDVFGSDGMRQAMGLLSAAGPSREPLSFGQRMNSWLQEEDKYKQGKADRAAQEQERQQRAAMQAMQMQQMQQAMLEQQQQREQQQRDEGLIRQSYSPLQGPTPDGSPLMPGRPDPRMMLAGGMSLPGLQKAMQLDQALNPEAKMPKLKSVEPMRGPDGKMVNVALFEDGSHKVLPYGVKPEIALQQLGDRVTAIDKNDTAGGTSFRMGIDPGSQLSANVAMRGQNMTDARAREKNSIDLEAVGKVDWKQDVNGAWVGLPKEVTGQGPVTPVTTTTSGKREMQARNALDIINEAKSLIDKGTGSYVGAGVDLLGKAVGVGTPGAVAGGQLKALEGALMMAQPRMEGPQSDKDVQLYRQMSAQLGDPTVPPAIKKAALGTIESLHKKYAGGQQAPMQGGPRPGVVQDGYRFKGGNPADPNSWEKM